MQAPTAFYDLLILGGSGFIGGRTAQTALAAGWSVACTYRSRPVPPGAAAYPTDLTDPAAVTALIAAARPRTVIHCAVNYASQTLDEASQMQASVTTTRVLLDAMRRHALDTRLIYVSTNAVFSGSAGPYRETDTPDPDRRFDPYRYYGLARWIGELLVLSQWPNSLVARTANVDGRDAWGRLHGRLQGLVNQLTAGDVITRYADRTLSPTLVDNVADSLLEAADPAFALPPEMGRILHLTGSQSTTDYAYARHLASCLGLPDSQVQANHYLPPGAAGTYNIALDSSATRNHLRTQLVGVDDLLQRIFARDG